MSNTDECDSIQLTREDYQALWNLADQEVKAAQRAAKPLFGLELDRANNTLLRWERRAERIAWHINNERGSLSSPPVSKARRLALEIAKLESSPLQKEYVPPHIQTLAKELLAMIGPHDHP